MGNANRLTPEQHKELIVRYTAIKPAYDTYAKALLRVLEKAKSLSVPEAIVQARPKAVASFAEKCVRKWDKYQPDPLAKMTDLCGARIVVHTLDQVEAVRCFVKCNFETPEEDEKGLMLGKDKFGYRDLHFLVRLKKDRAKAIGFTDEEIATIGDKIAELQVRTVVQHAWADILHDRMYKTKLIYPPEFQREGALLAAIMEDGDRQFNELANDIDGMLTNFNVYVTRQEIEREIAVQEVIHENADERKKPTTALGLAKLRAAQGKYDKVCMILSPHAQTSGPLRFEILLELGFSLCKANAVAPTAAAYRTGQRYLDQVIEECRRDVLDSIPNTRKRKSTLARALTRLAWSYERIQGGAAKARGCYLDALREEPGNPYYLSEVLAYEIECTRNREMVKLMGPAIETAVAACRQHAAGGTELPYAYLTAGRLLLLMGHDEEAVVAYAHGIRHLKTGDICVPPEILDLEESWVYRVVGPDEPSGGFKWVLDLIALHRGVYDSTTTQTVGGSIAAPVTIIAGSAGIGITEATVVRLTEVLMHGVADMPGSIISGGTKVGVPLCIAEAVARARQAGHLVPDLLGYLPKSLPTGVDADSRCRITPCGDDGFSPAQLLRYWKDILAAGISPQAVTLLGYGGGKVSAAEYAIALMLGAQVFLVRGSGRAADELLKHEADTPNLKGLPDDNASIQALLWTAQRPGDHAISEELRSMAKGFHANYVAENQNRIPANLRQWDTLEETYVRANIEQARYVAGILKNCGFDVVPMAAPGDALSTDDMSDSIEAMSELEHGRWNVERLFAGWRFGKEKDAKAKTQPCLKTWESLEDSIREYDRMAIRKYPEILASVGMKIVRASDTK